MACMSPFAFIGNNAIQGEYSMEGWGGRGNSVEGTICFSQQSLSEDRYPVSEGAIAEANTVNGLSDSTGFFELWEQDFYWPDEDTIHEVMKSEELAQERVICITWDFSAGYVLDSDILFVEGAEPEVRKRLTLKAELVEKLAAQLKELEGGVHGRESPGAKQSSSSAEGRFEFIMEELISSVINRELLLSGLEERGCTLHVDNDCCKVTIQSGDNATFIRILENPHSGASRSTNINSDVRCPMESRNISSLTETNLDAIENSLCKLEKMLQHIDLLLKELGIKFDNLYKNVVTVAGIGDPCSIRSNRVVDFDSAGTREYCSVPDNESCSTVEAVSSRLYWNDSFEGEKTGGFKEEDNFRAHLINSCASSTAEGPPEGLFYVLPYLELRELLALEQVSKSLRNVVRNDVLLWKSLHIEYPLNEKVTDNVLLRLSVRAQGQLQCLSLVQCEKVTERAVRQVLASNPLLLKLCLPGCTRVNIDAVVAMVKEHLERKSLHGPCLKQLRIRGLYGITREHVEQLHSMLITVNLEPGKPTPQYYHYGHYPVYCEDDRLMDVEVCPKCANVRVVYDCTRDRCQQKHVVKQCRGCTFCIARCEGCGTCIDDIDYEETFCLGLLCSACWLRLPKCVECNSPGCGKHVDHFTGNPGAILLCTDWHGSSLGDGAEFYVTL